MLILMAILFQRECVLAWANLGNILRTTGCYLLFAMVFPLALSGTPELLAGMALAIIWAGALLAMMLAIPHFYRDDWQDGTLEQMRLLPLPLEAFVVVKVVAGWCIYALPQVLCTPLIALILHLETEIWALSAVLALGLFGFVLLGSVIAALTIETKRSTGIAMLLLMPLSIPIIIFGAHAAEHHSVTILIGIVMLLAPLTVMVSAEALRNTR